MRKPFAWILAVCCVAMALVSVSVPSALDAGAGGGQKAGRFDKLPAPQGGYRYLVYTPPAYNPKSDKKWPVLLFLHGSGESGDDLEKVKIHGPPKVAPGMNTFWFVVIAPQSPGEWWRPEGVLAVLDDAMGKYKLDSDRVCLTGLSLGGYGSWELAARHPERFAAVAPICGGGNPRTAERLKDLPIWVFHGAKDTNVPVKRSEEMVEAIKQAGGKKVDLTIYPEKEHDSWTVTYDNPELYDWFRRQRRAAPETRNAK